MMFLMFKNIANKRHFPSQRGIALPLVLVLSVVFFLLVATTGFITIYASQKIDSDKKRSDASYITESGFDQVVNDIWVQSGFQGQIKLFDAVTNLKNYLSNNMKPDMENMFNSPSTMQGILLDPSSYDPQGAPALSVGNVNQEGQKYGAYIVAAMDNDVNSYKHVDVKLTGTGQEFKSHNRKKRVTLEQVVRFKYAKRNFPYAILANNINCIMCHANVDHKDPTQPVRVASLESITVRTGNIAPAQSRIAGSLYTKGGIFTSDAVGPITEVNSNYGTALSAGGKGLDALKVNNGVVAQPLDEVIFDESPGGYDKNLYMNYTGKDLPDYFPQIEDYAYYKKEAEHHVKSDSTVGSKLTATGGGTLETTTTDYASRSNSGNIDEGFQGRVILEGPMEIDGPIVIEGDLVIKGIEILGKGSFYVSGNIYMIGDIVYDTNGAWETVDGKNTHRTDLGGGQYRENQLAMAAGGNILGGDYQTPHSLKQSSPCCLFDSNATTTARLNNPNFLDPGSPQDPPPDACCVNGEMSTKASFTMTQVVFFNKREYGKAQADPNYVPRYYRLRPSDPVYFYDGPSPEEGGPEEVFTYEQFTEIPADDLASANISDLSPDNGWIAESELKQMSIDYNNARLAAGDTSAMKIDSLLYTGNAIFALAQKDRAPGGRIEMNGSIISADIGILSPGGNINGAAGAGFNLHYDQRQYNFLDVPDYPIYERRNWRVIQR